MVLVSERIHGCMVSIAFFNPNDVLAYSRISVSLLYFVNHQRPEQQWLTLPQPLTKKTTSPCGARILLNNPIIGW